MMTSKPVMSATQIENRRVTGVRNKVTAALQGGFDAMRVPRPDQSHVRDAFRFIANQVLHAGAQFKYEDTRPSHAAAYDIIRQYEIKLTGPQARIARPDVIVDFEDLLRPNLQAVWPSVLRNLTITNSLLRTPDSNVFSPDPDANTQNLMNSLAFWFTELGLKNMLIDPSIVEHTNLVSINVVTAASHYDLSACDWEYRNRLYGRSYEPDTQEVPDWKKPAPSNCTCNTSSYDDDCPAHDTGDDIDDEVPAFYTDRYIVEFEHSLRDVDFNAERPAPVALDSVQQKQRFKKAKSKTPRGGTFDFMPQWYVLDEREAKGVYFAVVLMSRSTVGIPVVTATTREALAIAEVLHSFEFDK
ncbi:hypothetical protein pEaSNUABM52_00296 [Erwinia phage pEp_SNUABM_52]|nr:hypothetical protein pEaSNUABM52_00296 [Erwinia phage pEp_SNUABM_52]